MARRLDSYPDPYKAIDVACETCVAMQGNRCISLVSGKVMKTFHVARHQMAKAMSESSLQAVRQPSIPKGGQQHLIDEALLNDTKEIKERREAFEQAIETSRQQDLDREGRIDAVMFGIHFALDIMKQPVREVYRRLAEMIVDSNQDI